jgi:transcriptional regulator with XRE-family HTH domain
MDNKKLVENIRRICKMRNISVSELERSQNFSLGLISRWVRMSPSLDKVLLIARYLGGSIDELAGNAACELENDFVGLLMQMTEGESREVYWRPFDEENFKYDYARQMLEDELVTEYEAFACNFEDGIFLLLRGTEDNSGEIYRLYIIPGEDELAVMEEESAERLEPLWNVIEAECRGKHSREKADELKGRFIKAFGCEKTL